MQSDPEFTHDTFSLPEGIAEFFCPRQLSTESLAEIKDWMGLILGRLSRTVTASPTAPPAPQD